MTHLSDYHLELVLDMRQLVIEPDHLPLQPASIDLRLGDQLRLPPMEMSSIVLDPAYMTGETYTVRKTFERHLLKPGEFVQAVTYERITLENYLEAIVTGKSSLARIGIQIESAGYVDPGWDGQLTLEIKNLGPWYVWLTAGMPICQLRVAFLSGPAERGYGHPDLGSHYQGSTGPVSARFGQPAKTPEQEVSDAENGSNAGGALGDPDGAVRVHRRTDTDGPR